MPPASKGERKRLEVGLNPPKRYDETSIIERGYAQRRASKSRVIKAINESAIQNEVNLEIRDSCIKNAGFKNAGFGLFATSRSLGDNEIVFKVGDIVTHLGGQKYTPVQSGGKKVHAQATHGDDRERNNKHIVFVNFTHPDTKKEEIFTCDADELYYVGHRGRWINDPSHLRPPSYPGEMQKEIPTSGNVELAYVNKRGYPFDDGSCRYIAVFKAIEPIHKGAEILWKYPGDDKTMRPWLFQKPEKVREKPERKKQDVEELSDSDREAYIDKSKNTKKIEDLLKILKIARDHADELHDKLVAYEDMHPGAIIGPVRVSIIEIEMRMMDAYAELLKKAQIQLNCLLTSRMIGTAHHAVGEFEELKTRHASLRSRIDDVIADPLGVDDDDEDDVDEDDEEDDDDTEDDATGRGIAAAARVSRDRTGRPENMSLGLRAAVVELNAERLSEGDTGSESSATSSRASVPAKPSGSTSATRVHGARRVGSVGAGGGSAATAGASTRPSHIGAHADRAGSVPQGVVTPLPPGGSGFDTPPAVSEDEDVGDNLLRPPSRPAPQPHSRIPADRLLHGSSSSSSGNSSGEDGAGNEQFVRIPGRSPRAYPLGENPSGVRRRAVSADNTKIQVPRNTPGGSYPHPGIYGGGHNRVFGSLVDQATMKLVERRPDGSLHLPDGVRVKADRRRKRRSGYSSSGSSMDELDDVVDEVADFFSSHAYANRAVRETRDQDDLMARLKECQEGRKTDAAGRRMDAVQLSTLLMEIAGMEGRRRPVAPAPSTVSSNPAEGLSVNEAKLVGYLIKNYPAVGQRAGMWGGARSVEPYSQLTNWGFVRPGDLFPYRV